MKKRIFMILGMLMMVSTIEAKNNEALFDKNSMIYAYDNAVNFIEKGVEFYIFTNGDFDFNTHYSDLYYNNNRRRFRNNDIRIERDYSGRIYKIGNVFINYDTRGNVRRVGNVLINYRRNRLRNVGNLTVKYDRWGNPIFYGTVKNNFYHYNGVRINLNLGQICNYNDAYFFRNDFRRNYTQFREDSRFFYYKANRNANIGNRSKIIKRRKPVAANRNNNVIKNRKNNSYRKQNSNSRRAVNIDSQRTKVSNIILPSKRTRTIKTETRRNPKKNNVTRNYASKSRKKTETTRRNTSYNRRN